MGVPGPCAGARVGLKGQGASTLQPKRLPIHREPQHLQRGLERSIGSLSFLPDDAVAGRDILASCCNIPAACSGATPTWLVNDLQVEDDATSLDLPGFDSSVEDADGLGERGDVHAGREATGVGEGGRHWV